MMSVVTANVELDYIVWQYLQKETPSLATEFLKLKEMKEKKLPTKVSLDSIYEMYTKNEHNTVKRQDEKDDDKAPLNKKPRFQQDEKNDKAIDNSVSNKKTQLMQDVKVKKDDKSIIKKLDNVENKEKSAMGKKSGYSPGKKFFAKESSAAPRNNRRIRSLLPKPFSARQSRSNKTLLPAPLLSFHQNDPDDYDSYRDDYDSYRDDYDPYRMDRDDTRRTSALLPEPYTPTVGGPERKTLLAEPLNAPHQLYSVERNERKPLLPNLLPPQSEDDRVRKSLLKEPLHLGSLNDESGKSGRKTLLMEPCEEISRIDKMRLLAESPFMSHLYPDRNERLAILAHPAMSAELDVLYRKERKSLLNQPLPPMMLQDYIKQKEKKSLLMEPPSQYYNENESRDRKIALLNKIPPALEEDIRRSMLLADRSPSFLCREYPTDPVDLPEVSSHPPYSRKEINPLPKSLSFREVQGYEDSHELYSRRTRAKNSDIVNWEEKDALLPELPIKSYLEFKEYLKMKERLTRGAKNRADARERSTLLPKSVDFQDLKKDQPDMYSHSPELNTNPDVYYMREKNALLARNDYYREFPDPICFDQNSRADKSGSDFPIRKERGSTDMESRAPSFSARNYEELLKSTGFDINSEIGRAYRRAAEKDIYRRDHVKQHRSVEQFDGKMHVYS